MTRALSTRFRSLSSIAVAVAVIAAGGAQVKTAEPAAATSSFTSPTVFSFTGAPQIYTVPANVDTLFVQLVGGSGGGGTTNGMYQVDSQGGAGGQVITVLQVTPGESLQINVGGAGQKGPQTVGGDPSSGQTTFHIAKGGWNGGGDAGFSTYTFQGVTTSSFVGNFAGGGGGATDIRACFSAQNTICPTSTRIAVAGGGGGAGMDNGANTTSAAGGAGGVYADGSGAAGNANPLNSIPTDGASAYPPGTINATPGQGATPSTPGAGGAPTNLAPSGLEGAKFCSGGPAGQGGVPGAGQAGTSEGIGGSGGSGEYSNPGFWSTTFGGGGGGGGYTGGGGGGCGGFAWKNLELGAETVYLPGTAAGGGGSSWVDPTRAVLASTQFGAATLKRGDGYVVIQGLTLGATGAPQAIAIPTNADEVDYILDGAQGGDYGLGAVGGRGATITGSLDPFTPGDVLQINVGGGGQVTDCGSSWCPPTALGGPATFDVNANAYTANTYALESGWNGGGFAVPLSNYVPPTFSGYSYPQAGGGGATDLRVCAGGTSITSARSSLCSGTVAIAAGGGGGSVVDFWESAVTGGAGGCLVGQEPDDSTDGGAGRGGTQSAGGIGGGAGPSGSSGGSPGSAGTGGDGGLGDTQINQDRQGSGGGAGYFGGGGGGGGGSVGDALFHSPGAGGGGSSLVPAGATCTQGTGPAANATYSSADGTAQLSFPVLVPGQPFNVRAAETSTGSTTATIEWAANGEFGSAITAAQISLSSDNGSTWSTPQEFSSTSPATVTGLQSATEYVFRVALVNSYGSSPWSKQSNRIRIAAAAPAQVTGVTASAAPNGVGVSWTAPADNGSPITSYTVEWSSDNGTTWDDISVPAANTTAVIGNLTSASSYVARVAAVNAVGTGSPSVNTSAVTPIGIPTAPGTPTATAEYREIDLSWTAASVAGSPGNGQGVTGYQVEATDTVTGEVALIDTGSTSTTYTVKGIFNGHPITFRVRGFNGDVPGDWSNASSAVTADTAATAPLSVEPTREVAAIGLSWTAPAALGGGTIEGYRIERLTPGQDAEWTTALVTSSPATSATVTGLTPGVGYRFRVAAVTEVPIGGGASADVVGTWSFPTFTLSPLPRSGPGPAPAPTPTPKPTPTASTSPTPSPSNAPASSPLPAPGTVAALVDGVPVEIRQRRTPKDDPIGTIVNVAGVRGSLLATNTVGRPNELSSRGALVLDSPRSRESLRSSQDQAQPSGRVQLRITGMRERSPLLVTIVSSSGTPIVLGSPRADQRGEIDALLAVPTNLTKGPAALRLTGTNARGQQIELTFGVRLTAVAARKGAQRAFDLDKRSRMTPAQSRELTRLARGVSKRERDALVVLVLPVGESRSKRDSTRRSWLENTSSALRRGGFTGSIRVTVTTVPTGLPNSVTVTIK